MPKIVHISDLHFGNLHEYLLDALVAAAHALKPDLTVLSGDFVERATAQEFESARAFIDRLPQPQLCVAGNHDLPFYEPWRRYREKLDLYQDYIRADLQPIFRHPEMLVLGLNTPRILRVRGGRINDSQVARVIEETRELPKHVVKIVVTHHPLDLPLAERHSRLVIHARRTVDAIAPYVDLLLAGHLHRSSTGGTAARYRNSGHSVVFAQAGSATSRRNKGEPNSFNFLDVNSEQIQIQHFTWCEPESRYAPRQNEVFEHGPRGWFKRFPAEDSGQILL
jgi:3',5'-cyclic AMP phosphodiesterase CpdA